MTPEQKALFTQYEELKRTVAELEDEMETIKPQLLVLIPEDSKIDTGTGVFTLSSKKQWKYSKVTNELEERLKERKREEEQTGVAEAVSGAPFVVFKAKK